MMTQQYIDFNQSNVRNLPINLSRAPRVGDILIFTGVVKVVEFNNTEHELLVFIDHTTDDEVTMSAGALMHAHGSVRSFFKKFSCLGDAMDRAISDGALFYVNRVEIREMETPSGTTRIKTFTIDYEN